MAQPIAAAAVAAFLILARWRRRRQRRANAPATTIAGGADTAAAVPDYDGVVPADDGTSDLIFLGTGSSAGTPFLQCLLGLLPSNYRGVAEGTVGGCPVCKAANDAALHGGAHANRNWRGNPSALVRYRGGGRGRSRAAHVQFDCGKSFREAAARWYPRYNVRGIDAVVLTHPHADAVLGIDDLRSCQRSTWKGGGGGAMPSPRGGGKGGKGGGGAGGAVEHPLFACMQPIDLFMCADTRAHLARAFGYLVPRDRSGDKPVKISQSTFTH